MHTIHMNRSIIMGHVTYGIFARFIGQFIGLHITCVSNYEKEIINNTNN